MSLLHLKAKRKGNNTNISKLSESITFLIITNIITRAKWSEIDDQSWYYDFRIKCKEDFLSDFFQVVVHVIFWHRMETLELNGLVPTQKCSRISIHSVLLRRCHYTWVHASKNHLFSFCARDLPVEIPVVA